MLYKEEFGETPLNLCKHPISQSDNTKVKTTIICDLLLPHFIFSLETERYIVTWTSYVFNENKREGNPFVEIGTCSKI